MDIIRLRCTNCGANFSNVDLNVGQQFYRCNKIGCGATFAINQGAKFADVDNKEADKVSLYRSEIKKALSPFQRDLARTYAENILAMIPEDYRAKVVYAVANATDDDKRPIHELISNAPEYSPEEFAEVFPVLLAHSDYKGITLLKKQVEAGQFPQKDAHLKLINEQFAFLQKKESDYANVPRDVFVCHLSDDKETVMKVVEALEKDGNTCWISERNMPEHTTYYWEKIEAAISQCKVFLAIVSDIAMRSEAVQKELEIAKKLNKEARAELVLEEIKHTSLFRHFFDGIQWVEYDKNDFEGSMNRLKERIFCVKEKLSQKPEPASEPVPFTGAKRKFEYKYGANPVKLPDFEADAKEENASAEPKTESEKIPDEPAAVEDVETDAGSGTSNTGKGMYAVFSILSVIAFAVNTVLAFMGKRGLYATLAPVLIALSAVYLIGAVLNWRVLLKKSQTPRKGTAVFMLLPFAVDFLNLLPLTGVMGKTVFLAGAALKLLMLVVGTVSGMKALKSGMRSANAEEGK